MLGAIFPVRRGVTGDFAFDEREFEAANSGGFASAEYSGDRGLLILIHRNKVFAQAAAAHAWKLDVGNEMKAASKIVTFDFAGLSVTGNAHGFHAAISEGGDRPTIGPVRDAAKIVGEAHGLGGFAPDQHHLQSEARHLWTSGLLADADHFRATFPGVGGDCKDQRTSAGNNDASSGYIEAGFYEGLETAGAHDVWKSPAGKGQEKFACARREN